MRILTLALGSLFVMTFAAGCGSSQGEEGKAKKSKPNPYVGKWKGKDSFGQTMTLTLKDDGQLLLHVTGRRRGWTRRGTWKMDTKPNPPHFEIDLRNRMPINTICKLEGDRFVFENINSSDRRPTRFGRRRIIMTRQK